MKRFKISSWFFFLIVFNFNCYLSCIPANMTVAYECIPMQAAHIDYFAGTLLDQSQTKFGQESYARNQTYVINLLSTCNLIRSDTFVVPVLPDDCHVIDSICSDN